MKRELILEQGDITSTLAIRCPPGGNLRVVGFYSSISGTVQGDALKLAFRRGQTPVLAASGPAMVAAVTEVAGFIGAERTQPFLVSTVVATGVAIYDQTCTMVNMPLPDIVWDRDVTVKLSCIGSAAVTAYTVFFYERISP